MSTRSRITRPYRFAVPFDVHVESVALFEGQPFIDDRRGSLTRRVRYLAVAADRDGDVAVAAFLKRGRHGPEMHCYMFERRDSGWRYLGGGGGSAPLDVLADRPSCDDLGGRVVVASRSSTLRNDRDEDLSRVHLRYLHAAQLRLSAEAVSYRVRGVERPVPRHGCIVVVWSDVAPVVVALDADGQELASVDLGRERRV